MIQVWEAPVGSGTLFPAPTGAVEVFSQTDPSTLYAPQVGDRWRSIALGQVLTEPSTSYIVTDPSMDINTMCQSAPTGATIVVRSGGSVYKQYNRAVISPKQGQLIWLHPDVVIDGAQTITGWTPDGLGHWSASGHLPAAYAVDSGTQSEVITGTNANLAGYMEDMFLDGSRMLRVGALSAVTTGTCWQDYTNNKIWVGVDPTGHLLEMATARTGINITASGVTWTANGSIVQRFANAPQSGAFNVRAGGCAVTNLVTQYNHAVGTYFANGGNSTRTGGIDRYNGQLGMSCYANSSAVIDGVTFYNNNPQGLYRIMDWESGGIKCATNTNLVVKNCVSHDNRGLGYWQDSSNRSSTFLDCIGYNNSADGCRLEISWGAQFISSTTAAQATAYLYNNCLEQVTKFDGTAVRGSDPGPFFSDEININDSSTDANNGNKITLIKGVKMVAQVNNNAGSNVGGVNGMFAQARPRSSGGVTWTLAATIQNCDIKIPAGGRIGSGNLSGADFSQVFYIGNTYRVPSATGAYFQIGNTSPMPFAAWQAAGQDPTGTLIVEP